MYTQRNRTRFPSLLIFALAALVALATVPLIGYYEDAPVEARGRDSNRKLKRELENILKANTTEEDKIKAMHSEVNQLEAFDAESVRALIEFYAEELEELKENQKLGALELAVLDKISGVTDKDVLKELREDLLDFELPLRLRARLFDAIASDQGEDTSLFMIELTENASTTIRMFAVQDLGKRLYKDAFDALIKRVRYDANHRVRKAAVEAITVYGRKWDELKKQTVQALIDLMVRVDVTEGGGMLVGSCADALKKLSGEDFGADPAAWAKWWRQQENKAADDEGEDKPRRTDGAREYKAYGISTMSKKVVFVVDSSSSMLEKLSDEEKKEMQGDATTGEERNPDGSKKAEIDWTKINTKWDFAREELKRIVSNLDEKTRFTIISYNDNMSVWEDDIQEADKKNKEKALAFIDKISVGRRTNMYDAISGAIELAEKNLNEVSDEKKKKERRRPRRGDDDEEDEDVFTGEAEDLVPDTIYFLTDGLATAGKYRGPDIGPRAATKEENELYFEAMKNMLAEIKERNRVAQITIHAVGIGKGQDNWTLKRLAEQNSGTYVSYGK